MTTEINIEEVYKAIKKQNGEQFAKILRENVLLNIPNLQHILEFAGKNPADATALVPILREIQQKSNSPTIKQEVTKAPLELLFDAGYDAFYVNTLAKQNSIRKYFRPNEELCTFRDNSRYKNFYMIHAVKRGADKIKPSTTPKREDEYGTSVISIQIAKNGGFISIKNRYNHTVNDPDNTFNSNPDNIISGLSESLRKHFNVDFMSHVAFMPDNYRTINDQLVRYNYEIDNTYFDEKYYFCGSNITKLNTDHEVMLDNVILDTKTNKVRSVLSGKNEGVDELVRVLNDEISVHTTKIGKDKTTQETVIKIVDENKQEQELARTKNGCITSLNLYKTEKIGNGFLYHNKTLKTFNAQKLQHMGPNCFYRCPTITSLNLPKLKTMGDDCFCSECPITELYIPECQNIGSDCFRVNNCLEKLNAPKLKKMGGQCFGISQNLNSVYVPELEEMDDACFCYNDGIKNFYTPKLKKMGASCFENNTSIETLYIPELQEMGESCFMFNKQLKQFQAPKLTKIGNRCFCYNTILEELYITELQNMGADCFTNVKKLKKLYAPKLKIDKNTPDCIRYFNKNIFQIARAKLEERLSLSNKNTQNNISQSETIDR